MKDETWIERVAVMTLEIGAGLCLSALVVVVCLGIVDRFLLQIGWGWPEETARFLLIWAVFLSAAACTKRGLHYSIDYIVVTFCGEKVRSRLEAFALAFFVGITCVFGWTGGVLTYTERTQSAPALKIPMSYVYAAIPISAGFMLLFLGIKIMTIIRVQKGDL